MEELPPVELNKLREKIITDDIKEYSDLKQLKSLITKLKEESDDAINQFKDVVLMLTDELSRITGDHMLNMYKDDVNKLVSRSSKIIVDNLIMKCYNTKDGMLRGKIIVGDESFFMNNNLDEFSDGDSSIVDVIFKFKNFWGKLKPDNKEIIKNTLIAIISLCDVRYLNFKKYTCLKQLNKQQAKLFMELDKVF